MDAEPVPICPHCRQTVSTEHLRCPHCRCRVRYKTMEESLSWTGFGVIDLVPGIRDLPDPVRLLLVLISAVSIALLLGRWL